MNDVAPELGFPNLYARQSPAPTFVVIDEPGRFVAIEVSSEPFDDSLEGTENHRVWGSWSGGLQPPGPIQMPDTIWRFAQQFTRLYVRSHSSRSATEWIDHKKSATALDPGLQSNMLLCNGWLLGNSELSNLSLSQILAQVSILSNWPGWFKKTLDVLTLIHPFTAGRPISADQLEWFVIAFGSDVVPEQHQILIQRFSLDFLRRIGSSTPPIINFQAHEPTPEEREFNRKIAEKTASWSSQQLGPFQILTEHSPIPTEVGGSAVLIPDIDQFIVCALTKWGGNNEIILPAG